MLDEEAIISKVQYLTGEHVRRCGGHKREGAILNLPQFNLFFHNGFSPFKVLAFYYSRDQQPQSIRIST